MKKALSGAIAIASLAGFACTTTTETKNVTPAPAKTAAPSSWHSKLSLATRVKPTVIAAVAKSKNGGFHVLSGGGGTCGVSSGIATCDACIGTSCCAQASACAADPDCNALIACGDACDPSDDNCFRTCFTSHPSGANELDDLGSCADTSCATACGAPSSPPPGGPSGCGFDSGDATCDSCLDTSCCGDANACLGDADCTAVLDCEESCTDAACASACESAHPAGAAKLDALSTCATTTCGTACSGASGGGGGGGAGPSCGMTSGDGTCDSCLEASCCSESRACVSSADCVSVVQCEDACADSACATACETANPAGAASLNAVVSCIQTSCATTCSL